LRFVPSSLTANFVFARRFPCDVMAPASLALLSEHRFSRKPVPTPDQVRANEMLMRFPKGHLPPVEAFWSVTMYAPQMFFVSNPINRYAQSTAGLEDQS
jgi:hypothetical protein